MDFKNIHAIPPMDHKELNYPIDTMGVVFNTEAHFDDPKRPRMVFYIRDNIDSQIKCVATGKQAYAFRGLENKLTAMRGGQVIEALKMWRVWKVWTKYLFGPPDLWLETEGGISDLRFNPHLSEVEDFRKSLLNSDTYVQKYGVEAMTHPDEEYRQMKASRIPSTCLAGGCPLWDSPDALVWGESSIVSGPNFDTFSLLRRMMVSISATMGLRSP
ncbi:hypothetical protein Bca52824_033402 [Brassica carinata]|uniref:Uncharacterized protein n=1 Tax=Brassica carinata TaxID=52824 RepID=A0A8X7SE55_BRACI|nr:hypothetical protein Bca52824_033402 [Brassica carinata]